MYHSQSFLTSLEKKQKTVTLNLSEKALSSHEKLSIFALLPMAAKPCRPEEKQL